MKRLKVVTAKEMARIEALAIESGSSQEEFMHQAGLRVAEAAQDWIDRNQIAKDITLLVGRGNKSGDAFVAGSALLADGYRVRAYHLESIDHCKPLCKKFAEKFRKKGGELIPVERGSEIDFGSEGLLIDGLLGTGFAGQVTGLLKEVIERANRSGRPILAIDIPSGLNGSTGEVGSVAIQANLTLTLGLPKIGFFLQNGWNYVGELQVGEFGLPASFIEQAEAVAFLPELIELKQLLPKIVRNRHKYQAGCVIGFSGSSHYSGAPKLASLAALRAGAGIVKLFYPAEAAKEMVHSPYEVIHLPWEERTWNESLERARAIFLGPGIGQGESARKLLEKLVSQLSLPTVFDADALLSTLSFPSVSICTPHRGEMLRLLGEKELEELELLRRCQRFSEEKKTVLLLKGAPTWIFTPFEKPFLIVHGDPGMATAGSGDVLTGILASLLAQGCQAKDAALLGAMLHSLSGEAAAKEKTSHCLIASDLIDSLPQAFRLLQH